MIIATYIFHSKHIHSVDLDSRHVIATCIVVVGFCSLLVCCSHSCRYPKHTLHKASDGCIEDPNLVQNARQVSIKGELTDETVEAVVKIS